MSARAALRAATAAEHERVDRLFSAYDLGENAGYRRFLLAQAAAYLEAERSLDEAGAGDLLDDWPERQRSNALREDLAELGEELPEKLPAPAFDNEQQMWGGLYVLEGSRLGGSVLKRSVPEGAPTRFLNAPQPPGGWRKLLSKLDDRLYEPEHIEEAARAARQVFTLFERAGRRLLDAGRL